MKVFQALLMESKINARIINNLTIEFCSTHIIYMIYVGRWECDKVDTEKDFLLTAALLICV